MGWTRGCSPWDVVSWQCHQLQPRGSIHAQACGSPKISLGVPSSLGSFTSSGVLGHHAPRAQHQAVKGFNAALGNTCGTCAQVAGEGLLQLTTSTAHELKMCET